MDMQTAIYETIVPFLSITEKNIVGFRTIVYIQDLFPSERFSDLNLINHIPSNPTVLNS